MIEELKADAKERMAKSVEAMGQAFNKIRTGRAHPSLLDNIMVSYYGSDTPLSQVANIGVGDSRTLTVTPWEKNIVPLSKRRFSSLIWGSTPPRLAV